MKILFSALHFAYFRNFDSVIRGLAERGHQVHLVADEPESFGGQALVERLADTYPSVTWGWAPSASAEPWFPFAQKIRYALDYVRFLDPRYADVPKLRLRNIERAPRIVRWLTSGVGGALAGHAVVRNSLMWLERRLPPSETVCTFVAEQAPDALLLSSLTFSRSSAMEQLKAAKSLGIPTAACVMSWDHLSSKALLHIAPDRTLVWNEVQKDEAVEMHHLNPDTVVVTGAQCYDQWFDRQPTRTREEFCRSVGLDPAKPFVLYVCSAMSPVPHPLEPVFVKQWVEALRASEEPSVRDAGLLIRPHPERLREWNDVSLNGFDNVVVHGRAPIDTDAKADYIDSLMHCDAVVGLCTSAFLEAAIIGRPVLTLRPPAYRIHQDGMAHFRYLLTIAGGLLHVAADLREHATQLATAICDRGVADERSRRFVRAFVRPRGLDVPSTPAFIDAVEALPESGHRAEGPPLQASSWGGRLARRVATAGTSGFGAWLMMDAIDSDRAESERQRAEQKRAVLDERAARWEAERRERDERLRAKQEQRRSKERSKRVRGFSLRKQIARVKGTLKHRLSERGGVP